MSEEASFGLQFHTQMSQQPVAAGEDASSVAKRVHLFIPSHSECTSYGVPLHLPVIMAVLMEAAYSGNKEAAPAPPPSLHRVFRSLGSILKSFKDLFSEKLRKKQTQKPTQKKSLPLKLRLYNIANNLRFKVIFNVFL